MGERVAMGVIEPPYRPVEPGRPFHDKLLKGVGYAKLAVDYDSFAVADAIPGGLDQLGMAAYRYGAEIMAVKLDGWGRYLLR